MWLKSLLVSDKGDPAGLYPKIHVWQNSNLWTNCSYNLCSAQQCRDGLTAYSRTPCSVGNVVDLWPSACCSVMVLQRASRAIRCTTTFALGCSQFSCLTRRLQPPGSHTSTVCPNIERIACVRTFTHPDGSRKRHPLDQVTGALKLCDTRLFSLSTTTHLSRPLSAVKEDETYQTLWNFTDTLTMSLPVCVHQREQVFTL